MLNRSALVIHSFTVAVAVLLSGHSARAADGTWTQLSGGLATGTWSTASNWASTIVADGSGFTADFSTLDVSNASNSTITLSGHRTIGNLIFGDTNTATTNVWVLSTANSSTLTLAGTTPTITNNVTGEASRAAVNVVLAGSGGLTKAGAGIVSLGGANTYTGGTTINAGRLRARNSSAFGASSGVVTVASGAGLELDNGVTIANAINLNGGSALTSINTSNNLTGTVTLQSPSTISVAINTLTLGGALNLGSNKLTGAGSGTLALSGTISGSGMIDMTGISGATVISGNNSATYSGDIRINRNILGVGNNGALGTGNVQLGVDDQLSGIRGTDTNARTISNTLTIIGNGNSLYRFGSTTAPANGNLTFTSTTPIALGNGVKKFEVYARTEFAAGFTGTTGITMQGGTGTLVLAGTSTYTGATTVSAGTLLVNGSLASASAVTINSGGTLGGTGTVGATTVLAGGTFAPGASIGTMNFGQGLTLAGTSNFEIDPTLALGLNADLANIVSGVTYGGTLNVIYGGPASSFTNGMLFNLFDASSFNGSFGVVNLPALTGGLTWQNDLATNGTISVVPEPDAAVIVGGLGVLCLLGRRRNRAR